MQCPKNQAPKPDISVDIDKLINRISVIPSKKIEIKSYKQRQNAVLPSDLASEKGSRCNNNDDEFNEMSHQEFMEFIESCVTVGPKVAPSPFYYKPTIGLSSAASSNFSRPVSAATTLRSHNSRPGTGVSRMSTASTKFSTALPNAAKNRTSVNPGLPSFAGTYSRNGTHVSGQVLEKERTKFMKNWIHLQNERFKSINRSISGNTEINNPITTQKQNGVKFNEEKSCSSSSSSFQAESIKNSPNQLMPVLSNLPTLSDWLNVKDYQNVLWNPAEFSVKKFIENYNRESMVKEKQLGLQTTSFLQNNPCKPVLPPTPAPTFIIDKTTSRAQNSQQPFLHHSSNTTLSTQNMHKRNSSIIDLHDEMLTKLQSAQFVKRPKTAKEMEEIYRLMKGLKALNGLSDAVVKGLCEVISVENYKKDVKIFSQGEYGSTWYVVLRGLVHVYISKSLLQKDNTYVAAIKPGDGFGENGLTTHLPRTATLISQSDQTLLLKVERDDFSRVIAYTKLVVSLKRNPHSRTLEDIKTIFIGLRPLKAFTNISDFILNELCGVITYTEVEANRAIFCQGEEGTAWYVILKGRCTVMISNTGRIEDSMPVSKIEQGSGFGELAIYNSTTRAATITSDTVMDLVKVESDDYNRIIKFNHEKEINERIFFLRKHPLFTDWTTLSIKSMAQKCYNLKFQIGDIIIEEGKEIKELFFIMKGKCKVYRNLLIDDVPNRVLVGTLEAPSYFATLNKGKSQVTIQAVQLTHPTTQFQDLESAPKKASNNPVEVTVFPIFSIMANHLQLQPSPFALMSQADILNVKQKHDRGITWRNTRVKELQLYRKEKGKKCWEGDGKGKVRWK